MMKQTENTKNLGTILTNLKISMKNINSLTLKQENKRKDLDKNLSFLNISEQTQQPLSQSKTDE